MSRSPSKAGQETREDAVGKKQPISRELHAATDTRSSRAAKVKARQLAAREKHLRRRSGPTSTSRGAIKPAAQLPVEAKEDPAPSSAAIAAKLAALRKQLDDSTPAEYWRDQVTRLKQAITHLEQEKAELHAAMIRDGAGLVSKSIDNDLLKRKIGEQQTRISQLEDALTDASSRLASLHRAMDVHRERHEISTNKVQTLEHQLRLAEVEKIHRTYQTEKLTAELVQEKKAHFPQREALIEKRLRRADAKLHRAEAQAQRRIAQLEAQLKTAKSTIAERDGELDATTAELECARSMLRFSLQKNRLDDLKQKSPYTATWALFATLAAVGCPTRKAVAHQQHFRKIEQAEAKLQQMGQRLFSSSKDADKTVTPTPAPITSSTLACGKA